MPQAILDSLSVEQRTRTWEKAFENPGPSLNIVATTEDDLITGFCVFGPSRNQDADRTKVGEIAAIYVDPGTWRKGTGRNLCGHVLTHAKSRGFAKVSLWVLSSNEPAKSFYATLGFSPDGAEKRDSKLTGNEIHEIRYSTCLSIDG